MARAPLLQLSDITLGHGGAPLFSGLDLVVHPGDRLALVGRNGSGKSTLMKVMAGLVDPDTGTRSLSPGVTTGYMEQEPDFSGFATLGDFATATLGPAEGWKVEAIADGLHFDPALDPSRASGGERRRAALARLLAEAPELMLLDEPTNHLDITAIEWLEARLRDTRAAFVLISHDRALLSALTRATLWLDRGVLRRHEQGFRTFEDWRDKTYAEEDESRHKLDRKIKAEGRWAVEGISARRKRNQGRLRTLAAMRAERGGQIRRQGTADMALSSGERSGKLVVEALGISKSYDGQPIISDFSLRIMRGDRIAFVGPNGAGKTTLLRLLTGTEDPDSGTVRLGTNLEMAVFDQNRAQLDPNASLWENLTGDPLMRVSGRADQVMVRGQPRHVVGYLRDFLFDESRVRAPVRSLSGGERARLLLARIMARESNLLVLDEPTNDLDVETLDLLEDILGDYDGTVLLVSHDRDFIDRIATSTVVLEGQGRATIHAGGWQDYRANDKNATAGPGKSAKAQPGRSGTGGATSSATRDASRAGNAARAKPDTRPAQTGPDPSAGLSFTERHRLGELPDIMARLQTEIGKLDVVLSDPELYARNPEKFHKASQALDDRHAALLAAEEEWLDLAARAEVGRSEGNS